MKEFKIQIEGKDVIPWRNGKVENIKSESFEECAETARNNVREYQYELGYLYDEAESYVASLIFKITDIESGEERSFEY